MKHAIKEIIQIALTRLCEHGVLDTTSAARAVVERTRDPRHGEFACNVAMILAKAAGRRPRELANTIVELLPPSPLVDKVEIAGPGFINFFLTPTALQGIVPEILDRTDRYGRSDLGRGRSLQVEFVSANPTGPLHVGHGRGAAYGATLANLLEVVGYRVQREYYVNDAGRQMDILATSTWLRYLELCGEELRFPSNGYLGDYVWDFAASLHREHSEAFRREASEVFAGVPTDAPAGGDKEQHIDGLIRQAKDLLGAEAYQTVFDMGLNAVVDDIRRDLQAFGVRFDNWYLESTLTTGGAVARAVQRLRDSGCVYDKEGAQWFRSTDFGDEKDRVLVRENGQSTYFASDIAYHMDKLERGFERVIDVWGADHHGYVSRVKGSLQAMGADPERLTVLLVQFAVLYRGGQKVQMSTRSGEFITLRQLCRDVGDDAARFFYVMRRCEQHLDFDMDLAKSHSKDNPVYYIQYAHARVCSVFRQLKEKRLARDESGGNQHLYRLNEQHEQTILLKLGRYPEILEEAAAAFEPHQIAHYLRELANDLHTYYDAHKILVDDPVLRDARLNLITAVRQVLKNGLAILGVSAPEQM